MEKEKIIFENKIKMIEGLSIMESYEYYRLYYDKGIEVAEEYYQDIINNENTLLTLAGW